MPTSSSAPRFAEMKANPVTRLEWSARNVRKSDELLR